MSNKTAYFFLGLAAVLAAAAIGLLIWKPGVQAPPAKPPATPAQPAAQPAPAPIGTLDQPAEPETPEEILENLGVGLAVADPSELLTRIGEALEKGDMAAVSKLIGKQALDSGNLAALSALADAEPLRLRRPGGVREIGELELNRLARWALELEEREAGRDRILFDLRNENGKWLVEKLTLPPAPGQPIPKAVLADSLGVADAFLQAVLRQDFEFARDFVDPKTVSEAKIAALCILFEEGEYRMRSQKPLRAMFSRGDTTGYLANVETKDGTQSAQFALNLLQPPAPSNWLVSEINLDSLLADYAQRVAGGDAYYSRLSKNPAGGETLALYFGFDEDTVSDRTRRQLEIVSAMLKGDAGKKITLSGHTDALGTAEYNDALSAKRAAVVRDFLAAEGVPAAQIITLAKGASQPRRPNLTETGEDNPDGRRANRRTEIYLDF
ncbi:OmpA family protein [Akkermansiaceae bacterium]|nr:OmpA family protein [Akkermansiaceae bacterium]